MDQTTEYLNKLNPQQREAAMHQDGPLLILAGAGSGKTSTMTHRIAYLIREKGVSPYNILAVTFTNKAAKEMRDRVEALVGGGLNMWILTFHAACLRILRMYGDRAGYGKNFVVYDPDDQKTVIRNALKERAVEDKKMTPAYFLSIISDCKEKEISPEDYENANGSNPKVRLIADVYRTYEKTLKANNAMDFDDLILRAVQLLSTDAELLQHFQEKFRYIMVDEYQDTNFMQYRFIKLLAQGHNNLCVVGDDDQCIYQWRGADINNILDFEKDFKGAKVIKLEQNYRSNANILAAAHSVIKNNRGRKPKELWTQKDKGEKIRYYRADDDKEEARFISVEIDRLCGMNYSYSDVAVLYRTNAQSRRFEDAFFAKSIPYRVLGGFRYYDRKEVKDMMGYMRIVQNPADDLSVARIINEPKRGIGDKTVEKLKALASVRNESLFTVLCDEEIQAGLSAAAGKSIGEMAAALSLLIQERDNLKVSDIYDTLLVRTGYLSALEKQNTVESESRVENLLEFKSAIYDYEKEKEDANEVGSLSEFLEKISLMAEVDNHKAGENAVVLMTLHSAKGLEFPIVFMPGMEDGLFPSWRSFDKSDGIEEERRLCYVGITRAMERLYLTSSEYRTMYGRGEHARESVFLREIDRSLIEGDAIGGEKGFDRYSSISTKDLDYAEEEVFRPFSVMKSAAETKAARPVLKSSELALGDKVSHNKFGEGQVLGLEGNTATVVFGSVGVKKLALDIAPLKKL
jgi:DNA helicase II / ATP-dependent DNA helicase PcrA